LYDLLSDGQQDKLNKALEKREKSGGIENTITGDKQSLEEIFNK